MWSVDTAGVGTESSGGVFWKEKNLGVSACVVRGRGGDGGRQYGTA